MSRKIFALLSTLIALIALFATSGTTSAAGTKPLDSTMVHLSMIQSGSTVTFRSALNNKCLDADLNTIGHNGTKVQLWTCNGSLQQQWTLFGYPAPNISISIQSAYPPHRCLDADLNTVGYNGTKIQLWDCNRQLQQQWLDFYQPNGDLGFKNQITQYTVYRCLDADTNTKNNNGTKVQLWACNSQPQQQWIGG